VLHPHSYEAHGRDGRLPSRGNSAWQAVENTMSHASYASGFNPAALTRPALAGWSSDQRAICAASVQAALPHVARRASARS
jgi:hypothetical protein